MAQGAVVIQGSTLTSGDKLLTRAGRCLALATESESHLTSLAPLVQVVTATERASLAGSVWLAASGTE